jgi:hypothetical protein
LATDQRGRERWDTRVNQAVSPGIFWSTLREPYGVGVRARSKSRKARSTIASEQRQEAARLDVAIAANLKDLGYGG